MLAIGMKACFNGAMLKSKAIELLGGSVAAAAEAVGISYQAVTQWPDELPDRIAERVIGVLAKRRFPAFAAEVAAPGPGEAKASA